jgi:hypothetical protein
MVVLGRQVQVGEAAVAELRRERRIAADELGCGEAVALGLQDVVIVDPAELADRAIHWADEVGLGKRAHAGPKRAREEVVEAPVAAEVRVFGLAHVDAVATREPADQPRRHRAALRTGDAPGKGGQALLGQQVLQKDFEAIGHRGPLIG